MTEFEYVEAHRVWLIYAQEDMTEGRRGLAPWGDRVFATEQAAWDYINDRGGVMGRHPSRACYPVDILKAAGADNWQKAKATLGYPIDYDVRSVIVEGDPPPTAAMEP